MAREELGAKRVCPETGKKFYDLNKDPVVSPYTGKSYPRSFFEELQSPKPQPRKEVVQPGEPEKEAVEVDEEVVAEAPEFVPLEEAEADADAEDAAEAEEIPDLPEVEVEDDGAEDETFLEEEEDDDEQLSGVFEGGEEGEET